MPKRNTVQRRHGILALLNELGQVQVDELARRFETSEVTIRKDLSTLEQSGLLLRRYGGAIPLPAELTSTDENSEPKENISQRKQAIAQAAAALIRDHNRIIHRLRHHHRRPDSPPLQNKRGLVVNDQLTERRQCRARSWKTNPPCCSAAAPWDAHSESFQGQIAEQVLRSYDFRPAVHSAAMALTWNRGTTTFNELFSLSRVMAEAAREVVVLAEADKVRPADSEPRITLERGEHPYHR